MKILVTDDNIRIDKYLTTQTEYSRSTIQKMIESNNILVNNKPTKSNYILRNNLFAKSINFMRKSVAK